MYPPSQSFKPYYDATSSSEAASVHGDENEAFLEEPTPPQKGPRSHRGLFRRCIFAVSASVVSCIISLITASLVIFLLLLLSKGHPIAFLKQSTLSTILSKPEGDRTPALELQHMVCGSTPAEAQALGCVFDVMSFAWTPPACYDHTLSQSFLQENGPWTFYLDHNATQPLPFNELSNYDIVWTEHSYHVVHCLYAWERIHRAYLKDQLLLPREMGGINHTTHCVGLLSEVEGAPRRKVNAIAYLVEIECPGTVFLQE